MAAEMEADNRVGANSGGRRTITCFEHDILKAGESEKFLKYHELERLRKFYGEGGKNKPFFTLTHNGIKFCEYVGVLQVGPLTIEVLPKADKDASEEKWRNNLIAMLRYSGMIKVKAPTDSRLKLKSNSLLDLYFEMFINEVEVLLHQGLIKQYRKKTANLNALKGKLQFGKHIEKNFIHKERFYVRYSTYDDRHLLHFILYKTILLLKKICTSPRLMSRVKALILIFPEMPDIEASDALFNKISYSRKTERYRKAMEISKLLLLSYHPDLSTGRDDVLALMFDMNFLWERVVLMSLKRNLPKEWQATGQESEKFWEDGNRVRTIRPDIVVTGPGNKLFVLDTKWKKNDKAPSSGDLKQLYAYLHYFGAEKVFLVYPSEQNVDDIKGVFSNDKKECSLIFLSIDGTKWSNNPKNWTDKIMESCERSVNPT